VAKIVYFVKLANEKEKGLTGTKNYTTIISVNLMMLVQLHK
jgi:hypothetical protein